ncbi:MAG: hypothetical protein QOD74_245 [Variibacter sp.]|jgi:hypothetical protein|nr:hypothetical protein [Variibacter sp.]
MLEAELILPTMRGGCVRVGNKVHTLFRFTSSAPRKATCNEPRSLHRAEAAREELR